MASRPIVPQQHRGEVVVGGGKQKKNGAADGRNRRALGDIGNLVTARGIDGKPQPQISRPITRSFCAQLLANAQAAAAAENNKKQVCVNVDGAVARKEAKAAAQKKVDVKPKPEEVVIVSPDTEEEVKPDQKQVVNRKKEEVVIVSPDTEEEVKPDPKQVVNRKKEGEGVPSKKKLQAYTSVLTARSKAACGLKNKPKEHVFNIDEADTNNELAAVEYVEDIYKFYKEVENECRPHNYIVSQPEINEKMRAILVDWLIEVHSKFELMPETLYLTINIIDRFLSVKAVPRRELQLVGISAMHIASKYEEIWAPEVNDFVCIADRAYSHQQVLVMEKTILGKLEWTFTVPTPYVFLARFIKASLPDKEMENMVYFLAELGMVQYHPSIIYCPSMIAASAVYAARCTLKKTPVWNATLKLHTGFSEPQLMDCVKLLMSFHLKATESKLQAVYRKYSNPQRGAVALLPPAKSLA